MADVSWDAIEAFVRAEVGLGPSKPLTRDTRLWEDLGLTGDDANDFMGCFFERFQIDPGDFDFHRYFLMEGEGGLYSLFQRLVLRKPYSLQREPVTLGMLHRATVGGKWNSSVLSKGTL